MASADGAKRLKRLGAVIAVCGSLLAFLIWCVASRIGLGELVLMVGFPLFFGLAAWAVGWILEGFFSPPANDQ
jgi:uncharacterized membrane protein